MEAKVGVFGRGMASVKIQYFVDGRPYGMFKARAPSTAAQSCLGWSPCSASLAAVASTEWYVIAHACGAAGVHTDSWLLLWWR